MIRTPRLAVALALLCVLAVLAGGGQAVGGDSTTLVYPTQENIDTSHGESVELTVAVASDGGYNEIGLDSLTVVADYDTDYLTLDDAEPAGWLDGEGVEVTTDTTVDETNGTVRIAESRDPPKNGVTGNRTFATLTFTVPTDAPTGETTVSFQNSNATLVGDYPIYVYNNNATITVHESSPTPDDTDAKTAGRDDGESPVTSTVAGVGVIGAGLAVFAGIALFLRREA